MNLKKIKDFFIHHKEMIFILLYFIGLSLFMSGYIRKESDYLWHVTAGEYMLENGILTKDVFSWSANGLYWMSHEWLFEILIYLLKVLFGNLHYFVYPFISLFLLYCVIYLGNKKGIQKNTLFSIIWFTFSFIFLYFLQIRPHMLSLVFIALTIYILYDLLYNENSKKIYFLPIISILWANFHGGSSNLGYLLCFFFLFIGLFSFQFCRIEAKRLSKKQIEKYLLCGLLSIGCICINIHGVSMLTYPYINMLDTTMLKNITEWMPTSINDITHYPFFILVVFILFIFLLSKKKIHFIDFALFGLGIFLGLKSIRFWPYLYIISSFFIFRYVKESKDENLNRAYLIFAIVYFGISFVNFPTALSDTTSKKYISKEIIDILKQEKPERLFNYYDLGGELVYNKIPVFVDGRADLYSKYGIFNDYLSIVHLKNSYQYLIDKYDFDYYLVSNDCELTGYLQSSDDFELLKNDNRYNISLYKKR